MLNHNQGPWTMAGELERYIDQFHEADKLARELLSALQAIQMATSQATQNYQVLMAPGGKWPTQEELQAKAKELYAKATAVMAAYGSLPQGYREHAPRPQSIGKIYEGR